ncbi:MAG: pyruvate carboxyltransferase [Anaerolineales bacterium]
MSDLDRFAEYGPRPLEIIDSTLREGQQTSLLHDHHKYFFTRADKEELLRALIIFGVKFVELFAPVVSPQERDDFAALRAVRDGLVTQKGYTFLLAHVRCHPRDVESAIAAGADGLNFYIGTSPESRQFNHGHDLESVAAEAHSLLADVRRNHPQLVLRFSGEDAFRTRPDELFHVYDVVAPLVHRLGLPDTVGIATPALVAERVAALRERYPGCALEGHFHDDRGLSLINALTAVKAGVTHINTTVCGIGERSGITSLTALLFNLQIDRDYDKLEGYHLRGSYPLNVMVADKLKMLVPPQEPVSLTNRTHTAGVHQSAMLRGAAAYEAHPLDQFGVSASEILLGPLSGWNIIHYFLKEIRYFEVDEATARSIAAVFKEQVYRLGPDESPEQLLVTIAEKQFGLAQLHLPPAAKAIVQRLDTPAADPAAGQPAPAWPAAQPHTALEVR